MGHYSDSYEATRRTEELKRKEDLLRWISDKTLKMENWELEIVYEVVQNTNDYSGLFSIIQRAAKNNR